MDLQCAYKETYDMNYERNLEEIEVPNNIVLVLILNRQPEDMLEIVVIITIILINNM